MEAIRIVPIAAVDMLSVSVVVLFIGFFLNKHLAILEENNIPPAVTGGILFSILTLAGHALLGIELEFDMRLRDLLLLVFFSTVGLSARLGTLASGGKALAILVLAAGVFLMLQNVVGVVIAELLGAHPAYGLFAGSISFAGGHGTAIAWGTAFEATGLERAGEIGLAFATFGLVAGGLIGGPVARRLMASAGIEGSDEAPEAPEALEDLEKEEESESAETEAIADHAWLYPALASLFVLAICVSLGDLVNRFLSAREFRLPGFLTSMFVGILITNFADVMRRPVARETLDRFGQVSLHIFLAMSMMTIELWALGSAASAISIVLTMQILLMTFFAILVVFRLMGRNYDAVVISTGFVGLGLGATPIAIANMNAVTDRFGPSSKAFIVVPLVGAFFIDLLNAGTIQLFVNLIQDHLL